MSENKDYASVNLLIIITRLHAAPGANDDEFIHDWTPPPASAHAGVLKENKGFWMLSEDATKGLIVVHGYKQLLGENNGDFQNKILKLIKECAFNQKKIDRLAIFAHGDIPETEAKLGSENAKKPLNIQKFKKKFILVLPNNYTTYGNEAVALALPKTLLSAGIGDTLRIMVRERLKLEPVVDVSVRSMQHILLEMRLWCDLWFSMNEEYVEKKTNTDKTVLIDLASRMRKMSTEVGQCIDRLQDNEHWGNHAIKQVFPGQISLKEFLCMTESVTKYRELLDNRSGLSDINWTELDGFLCRCSARLEELIATARIEDLKRAE